MKEEYTFKNFEQLVDILNKIEIPLWVFKAKGILLELMPNAYLVNDLIYYIVEDKGRHYFRCIHISLTEDLLEFSRDFFEDFDTDMVPYSETNYTISTKYCDVLGFNKDTMTFFMKFRHLTKMYVEYRANTKQEIIHRYGCYGVINNRFPVIEVENTIAVVIGNEIKKIKDKDIREDYEIKDGYVYVYPTYRVPAMFRPYILMLDGSRIEITQNAATAYVIERIERDAYDISLFLDGDEDKLNTESNKENIVFSLDYIDSLLTEKYDMEDNKGARIYHFIVKLLALYLPTDKDVIDYFFLLSDVSKRLTKDDYHFIGEAVYWRLNELHLTGKLSNIINDKDQFKKTLLHNAYLEDDNMFTDLFESIIAKYVGSFTFEKGQLVAHTEEIANAICIGDMLFAKWSDKPGVVAFNLDSGAYEIQYVRELTQKEIELILDAYHIVDVAYCVSIDKCRV